MKPARIFRHDELQAKFDPVEKALYSGPYFNGKELSLVDASYAPLLQRLDYLDEIRPGIFDAARHPQIVAWKDALLKHPAVRESCVPKIKTLYHEHLWNSRGTL